MNWISNDWPLSMETVHEAVFIRRGASRYFCNTMTQGHFETDQGGVQSISRSPRFLKLIFSCPSFRRKRFSISSNNIIISKLSSLNLLLVRPVAISSPIIFNLNAPFNQISVELSIVFSNSQKNVFYLSSLKLGWEIWIGYFLLFYLTICQFISILYDTALVFGGNW